MSAKLLVMLALQVSIIATVFGFGLRTTIHNLLFLTRHPRLFAKSLTAMFVVMPLFAVALFTAFNGYAGGHHGADGAGLSLDRAAPAAAAPEARPGGRSHLLCDHADGNGRIAVDHHRAVSVQWIGRYFGEDFAMSASAIALVVLKTAIAPLAAGVIVRVAMPAVAVRIERPISLAGMIVLSLGAVALVGSQLSVIWAQVGNGSVLAITAFVVVGIAVGHFLGGPEPDDRVVLALATACRHPAIALAIASANLPDQQFGPTILLYLVLNALIGIPYIYGDAGSWPRERRRLAPNPHKRR